MQKPTSSRPGPPEQMTLLPPSLTDWLSDDHHVVFLLDLVDELELSAVLILARSKVACGEKGIAPRCRHQSPAQRLMLLLLYAYCVGRRSSP